ncbi:hypothetical protein FACS189485_04510 [Spirochaetia bacterium]|nr:hypothetical protein FACS189485_04510 [Spirochaetia bacterium]
MDTKKRFGLRAVSYGCLILALFFLAGCDTPFQEGFRDLFHGEGSPNPKKPSGPTINITGKTYTVASTASPTMADDIYLNGTTIEIGNGTGTDSYTSGAANYDLLVALLTSGVGLVSTDTFTFDASGKILAITQGAGTSLNLSGVLSATHSGSFAAAVAITGATTTTTINVGAISGATITAAAATTVDISGLAVGNNVLLTGNFAFTVNTGTSSTAYAYTTGVMTGGTTPGDRNYLLENTSVGGGTFPAASVVGGTASTTSFGTVTPTSGGASDTVAISRSADT